jgi:predicted permease
VPDRGPDNNETNVPVVEIPNLALPNFGLIFVGFACGNAKKLPRRAWMNFFLLYVSQPAWPFETA